MSSSFSDSDVFPRAARQHDPIIDDAVARDQRLTDDNARLFTPRDSLSVDVLDVFRNEPTTRGKLQPRNCRPSVNWLAVITHTDREAFQDCLRQQIHCAA
jgi:hypothetical protein